MKRYTITIDDNDTGKRISENVDMLIVNGVVKGDDKNRTVIMHVSGNYLDLCRAYTLTGKLINDTFFPSNKEK